MKRRESSGDRMRESAEEWQESYGKYVASNERPPDFEIKEVKGLHENSMCKNSVSH